jgi:DNA repair photolyase
MLRHRGRNEEWGTFVDVKINASEALRGQIKKTRRGLVLLSSVTDPYQPIEENYGLTRQCLRSLLEANFPISILTKSSLVIRDIDVLRQFTSCEVGLTITTLDEDVCRNFEPNASNVHDRLKALRRLKDAGLSTYVFFGPVLPVFGEASLEALAEELSEIGVERVLVDKLNLKAGNWEAIKRVLVNSYPWALSMFEQSLSVGEGYYERLKARISIILNKRGLKHDFCY